MPNINKVRSGDYESRSPANSAAWLNGVSEMLEQWNRTGNLASGIDSGRALESTSGLVKVRNHTGSDLVRGNYVQLGDYPLNVVEHRNQWYAGNLYDGAVDGRIAILTKAVRSDDTSYHAARILGRCTAVINITDTGHRFAAPADGEIAFQSAASGPVEILSVNKISGTGEQELAVLLGGSGTGGVSSVSIKIVLIDDDIDPIDEYDPHKSASAEPAVLNSGTATAGGGSTITLAGGASAVDDYYNTLTINTTGGTGSGQSRTITDYVGSTKVATVGVAWGTNPDATTTYEILGAVVFQDPPDDDYDLNHVDELNLWGYKRRQVTLKVFEDDPLANSGTATAVPTTSSITLDDDGAASTVDEFYNGDTITTTGGTGSGQTRTITDYVGSTRVATVDSDWSVTPDTTTTYEITTALDKVLATETIEDTEAEPPRLIVRYATTSVYYDDGDSFLVGEYTLADYPDYPEGEVFPPDGEGTYAEPPAGYLNCKWRGIVIGGVLVTMLCRRLPAPPLALAE